MQQALRSPTAPHRSPRCRARPGPAWLPAVLVAVLLLPTLLAAQPTGTVSGRIAQETEALAAVGAQVFLVGTGLGTLTGENGRFIIANVPPGMYTLRVERIGARMTEQQVEVRAGQTTTVNIVLRTEALGLDEIVVTGTAGAARRREIGNTVSQINVAALDEPPVNVDAVLQGRAAGLNVIQSSAQAGSGSMIRLRGNVSVTMSNQPIVYVDGVRIRSDGYARNVPPSGNTLRSGNDIASPLNDINPNDIARIEVIKGAAATTLYGTEAAAGVIQIFTKSGHQGRAQWTAQIDQGFAHTLKFGPDPSRRPPSEPAQTATGGTSDYLFINPWLRNGHRQRYALSVAGGGDALRYFVSGTIEDNESVLPNDREEKRVVRGNFTFSPMRNLDFQWNTSFTNTDISNTAAGNNAHGITLNAFRRDRNYRSSETADAIDPLLNQEITSNIGHLITGATITYSPFAGLTNRVTAGWDLAQVEHRNIRPFGFPLEPNGVIGNRRHRYQNLTLEYVGTINFGILSDLRSSFSWGGQSVTTDTDETSAYGERFPGPGEPTVSSAATRLGFEERQRVINAGFFFQNIFDFRDRYFLTVGVRVDGNSAFGRNLGLQTYPKASLSYVISEEPFWPEAFGQVKLRTAWGQSGRAPGAFDAVRTWDPVGWGGAPAFFPRNVGNDDIGPERTTEIEVGFDGAFFDNRLTAEFTWYRQRTTDALFNVRQVPSLGFLGSQLENVGELENKGIELTANLSVLRSNLLSWDVGGAISTNHGKVISLGGAPAFSLGNFGWVVEGEPIPVIRGRKVLNAKEAAPPQISQGLENYGPNQPPRTYQVNTQIGLPAGIQVFARGEYMGGHYMSDGAAFNAVTRSVRWPGCFDFYRLVETGNGDQALARDRARCTVAGSVEDYFIYPSDFFKVRELTLSVPVPTRFVPGSSNARLTLSGRNIWKWVNDDFPVFDPETNNNDGFNTSVRRILEHIPPPAIYTAAVRVTF